MSEIPGLVLIVPSSVSKTGASSSASVSSTGKVTYSLCESLSINDVFSSTYDNYLLVLRHIGSVSSAGLNLRLRVSGSDATGANYTNQYNNWNNTSLVGGRTSGLTAFDAINYCGADIAAEHVFLYGPNLAQPTSLQSVSTSDINTVQPYNNIGTHSLSTSYTGFTLLNPTSPRTVTGVLTIYGVSQ